MKKIGLISDTHSLISQQHIDFLKDSNEIWHAGDVGKIAVIKELEKICSVKAVYGNIDNTEISSVYPENLIFTIEGVKILITHIGGYPGRYQPRVRKLIEKEKPKIYIAGHSHILKVIYDEKYDVLHINPGAAGNQGYHKKSTAIRFVIDGENIKDLEILNVDRNRLRNLLR